jgi:MFS family permease
MASAALSGSTRRACMTVSRHHIAASHPVRCRMSDRPMSSATLSRRTVLFVNVAHALDHFLLLIYPTAVIGIAVETGLTYSALIALATGAFMAFGLFSLPMGWLADRYGRRNLLALFFAGCSFACLGLASADMPAAFAGWLFVLGVFTAIYHPIGSAMLVTHAGRLGRDLGWNGVWGNLGAACAPAVTALLAAAFGWRAAFIVPGIVCLAAGATFVAMVPGDGEAQDRDTSGRTTVALARPLLLVGIFAVAIMAGGMTFNITTIALPKIIDERLGLDLPLVVTGSLATGVFVFGALTQLLMGRLVDRYELPTIFVALSLLQPLGDGGDLRPGGRERCDGGALRARAIPGQGLQRAVLPRLHRERACRPRHCHPARGGRLSACAGCGKCIRPPDIRGRLHIPAHGSAEALGGGTGQLKLHVCRRDDSGQGSTDGITVVVQRTPSSSGAPGVARPSRSAQAQKASALRFR